MENFHSKVMLGMAIVGGIFQGEWDDVTLVMAGYHDLSIKCFAYHHQFGVAPATEAELDIPSVLLVLERIKGECRAAVQHVLDKEAKDQRDQLLAHLRNSNKPHAMGTVDQIAKRFGISKSEVRRRKADGTLGELLLAGPSVAAESELDASEVPMRRVRRAGPLTEAHRQLVQAISQMNSSEEQMLADAQTELARQQATCIPTTAAPAA